MGTPDDSVDVLVLGGHPSASLASALMSGGTAGHSVLHLIPPDTADGDRLVMINPELLALTPGLDRLGSALGATPFRGLKLLSTRAGVAAEFVTPGVSAMVAPMSVVAREIRKALGGPEVVRAKPLDLLGIDADGLRFSVNGVARSARMLLAAVVPELFRRALGLGSGAGRLWRYTYLTVASGAGGAGDPALIPMCLELAGAECWGWKLDHAGKTQLSVVQPMAAGPGPQELLVAWADLLKAHGCFSGTVTRAEAERAVSIDVPLAGALSTEAVANRALLIGPAGGFYSAGAEDVYPNCWSATIACDVAREALVARHLQDALQVFPSRWASTLGDYLRGPQQNLHLLLPIVYRNPVMAARVGEALLFGKSVVR